MLCCITVNFILYSLRTVVRVCCTGVLTYYPNTFSFSLSHTRAHSRIYKRIRMLHGWHSGEIDRDGCRRSSVISVFTASTAETIVTLFQIHYPRENNIRRFSIILFYSVIYTCVLSVYIIQENASIFFFAGAVQRP